MSQLAAWLGLNLGMRQIRRFKIVITWLCFHLKTILFWFQSEIRGKTVSNSETHEKIITISPYLEIHSLLSYYDSDKQIL